MLQNEEVGVKEENFSFKEEQNIWRVPLQNCFPEMIGGEYRISAWALKYCLCEGPVIAL